MSLKAGMSILGAALIAFAAAAPAHAVQVDRAKALDATTTSFDWRGDKVTSVNGWQWWLDDPEGDCDTADFGAGPTPLFDSCDVTLLTLGGPGDLKVEFPAAGDGTTSDWDLYVYSSDEDGIAYEELTSSENTGEAESATLKDLAAGSYLVIAVPYINIDSAYDGTAKFTPAPEPAP